MEILSIIAIILGSISVLSSAVTFLWLLNRFRQPDSEGGKKITAGEFSKLFERGIELISRLILKFAFGDNPGDHDDIPVVDVEPVSDIE